MENLFADVRVWSAIYWLNPRLSKSPFPVVARFASVPRRSRSRLVLSLAEPLPCLRRRSKCYSILNKPNFCTGLSQKNVCNAYPEIVYSRPPVVQTLDSAIHRINHYPTDKYLGSQSHHPLRRDLSLTG